jgi:hypothetical protein
MAGQAVHGPIQAKPMSCRFCASDSSQTLSEQESFGAPKGVLRSEPTYAQPLALKAIPLCPEGHHRARQRTPPFTDAGRLSQSKLSVTIRCNGIAVLAVSGMAAAIAHDPRFLLAFHVAVDASHPRVDLIHQLALAKR